MYFNLPKSSERLNKKPSNSSLMSTESTNTALMAEDRISEIIHNLDDHWGSPPILTPDTLAHILNNQWISSEAEEDFKKKSILTTIKNEKKVNSTKQNVTRKDLNLMKNGNNNNRENNEKVVTNLIKELCKTIQVIDTENKFEVTNDIQNDPVLQKFVLSKEKDGQSENVLEHLVELLKNRNKEEKSALPPPSK